MNYLLIYSDDKGKLYRKMEDTVGIEMADISARILANRKNGQVVSVISFDYESIIEKAIETKEPKTILEALKKSCGKNICMEHIKELASGFNIEFQEACTDIEYWYIINQQYVISFIGSYNVYGVSMLEEIIIYDETDSSISKIKLEECI